MIRELLQRSYLEPRIKWLAGLAEDGEGRRPNDGLPDGSPELSAEDYEAVARGLRAAVEMSSDEHLGDADRTAGPVPLEDKVFISRDPMTSLLQSALEMYFEEERPAMIEPDETDTQGAAGAAAPPITDLGLMLSEEQREGLFGAFEITDPGWVNSAVAMAWRRVRKRHDFVDRPAPPQALASNARVVLVADWGSGIKRAQRVGQEIRNVIEPDLGRREQHVIHLGDVYYSGWKREYDKRFLAHWPVWSGDPVGSWCLNANHDMFSGGHAYYEHLLKEPRFESQGGSSWFSLENDDWQLLGLDTAWDDHALKAPQPAWVADKLRDHRDRRTMLLSHHQLFSAYGHDGPKLRTALSDVLDSGRITSWFWGHEHRCVLYEPGHGGVGWARLIGHGGIPEYARTEALVPPATFQYTESFSTGLESWAVFGFAVLEFEGKHCSVRYINEFGDTYREEVIGGSV